MNGENKIARAQVVMSMERLVRCINNEDYIDSWLMVGVADGDITDETKPEEVVEMGYCEDETFEDLMTLFLKLMRKAGNYGGLFCDGIVSGSRHIEWR